LLLEIRIMSEYQSCINCDNKKLLPGNKVCTECIKDSNNELTNWKLYQKEVKPESLTFEELEERSKDYIAELKGKSCKTCAHNQGIFPFDCKFCEDRSAWTPYLEGQELEPKKKKRGRISIVLRAAKIKRSSTTSTREK